MSGPITATVESVETAPRRLSANGWRVLLAVAGMIAFLPGVRVPFYFDDSTAIEHNESVRTLSPLSVPLNPPRNTSVAGRPLVNLSFAINYAINNYFHIDQTSATPAPERTAGYHLVSIGIHVACGMLLFSIILLTVRSAGAADRDAIVLAGWSSLLWLLHPVHSQAVFYASARSELLVSFFILLTLFAAIRGWVAPTSVGRMAWHAGAVASAALGMFCKEVMAVVPIVVVLYDRTFRESSWRSIVADRGRRWFYAGLLASNLILLAYLLAGVRGESVGFGLGVPWYSYFYSQAWAVAHYLRLLVWPIGLSFDYGELPVGLLRPIPGLVVLAACVAGTVVAWRRAATRWMGFLGAWFFVILAPSSSIMPIRTEIAAERRVYVASAAIIVFAVAFAGRWLLRRGIAPAVRTTIGGCLAVILAIATIRSGLTYADPVALYEAATVSAPWSARAHVGAGLALMTASAEGSSAASDHLRTALTLDDRNFTAALALGVNELVLRKADSANAAFAGALRLRRGNPDARRGLARSFLALGQLDSAVAYTDPATEQDSDMLWNIGADLVNAGRSEAALSYLQHAASIAPHSVGLALLSVALANVGHADSAATTAERAVRAAGDTVNTYVLAARAAAVIGHREVARDYLLRALRVDSTSRPAREALRRLPNR